MLALAAAAMISPHCTKAVSTLAINRCEAREFAAADHALNAQWKLSMAAMKRRDGLEQPTPLGGPTYAKALLLAQQSWLAFRDSNCRVWGYRMRGGTAEPGRELACRISMTRDRTRELHDQVKRY